MAADHRVLGEEGPRIAETEGTGRAVRGAHAKTFGVVRAEVEILDDVPAAYAQGIYAKPGRHGALIRFSSASNHLGPDAHLGPVLGFAIKIFDVDGTKLVEDEPDCDHVRPRAEEQPDLRRQHGAALPVPPGGRQRLPQVPRARQGGFPRAPDRSPHRQGTLEQSDWAWEELFAFVKAAQTPVRNPLLSTYWTMAAVRHGDYVAKVRVAPAADSAAQAIHRELDLSSGPDVFGPALADELQARAFDFDLQVQLCTDLDAMPVNDVDRRMAREAVSLRHRRAGAPPAPGHLRPENFEKGDALAFNQWRVTDEHRPLGEIMDVRRIYTASAKVRRTLNHQPQTEPTSADEVLPWPELEAPELLRPRCSRDD